MTPEGHPTANTPVIGPLEEEHGHLAVTFPQSAAINEFIRFYTDRYPETELLARREPNRGPGQSRERCYSVTT